MKAAEERHRNRSWFEKLGGMSYTVGGMITGQIKSSPLATGRNAPMNYPQLFTVAFIGFVLVMVFIAALFR